MSVKSVVRVPHLKDGCGCTYGVTLPADCWNLRNLCLESGTGLRSAVLTGVSGIFKEALGWQDSSFSHDRAISIAM